MSQLRIESLSYMGRPPIDFSIDHGECISLSGSSGSGKSLLLRALADLDEYQGRIYLDRKECHEFSAPQWRKQVGLLMAESCWWFDTVGAHFEFLENSGDINGWLAQLDFDSDVMNWQINRLSTGEKQRLAIIRLLANRPKALLLDEPTASLDKKNINKVEDLLTKYRKENSAPTIWVSHDPEQEKRIASRHYRIKGDLIIEEGLERSSR